MLFWRVLHYLQLAHQDQFSGVWPGAAHWLILLALSGAALMSGGDECFNGAGWVLAAYCFLECVGCCCCVGWLVGLV